MSQEVSKWVNLYMLGLRHIYYRFPHTLGHPSLDHLDAIMWRFLQMLWQKATAFARPQEPFTSGTPSPSLAAHWPSRIRRPVLTEARCTLKRLRESLEMLLEFQVTYILFDGFAGSEIPNLNNWELAVLALHLQGVCVQTFTAKMVLPFWLKLVSLREKENFESTLCFSVACVFDRNGFHPNGHWQDSGTYTKNQSSATLRPFHLSPLAEWWKNPK